MAMEIWLGKNRVLVDDEDFEFVSSLDLKLRGRGRLKYVIVRTGAHSMRGLSRILLDAPVDLLVDHINHDPLDNRRSNLRLCTSTQNLANARKPRRKASSSRFKGVNRHGRGWVARIQINRESIRLGYFGSELEAARAYDIAAVKFFGEFAFTNKVDPRIKPTPRHCGFRFRVLARVQRALEAS
jgi:hypothetical protein